MADDIRGPGYALEEGDDDTLRRVRATLAPLPAADPLAVARVLAAVHGRAPSRWGRLAHAVTTLRRPGFSLVGGSTLLAAALTGIVMTRDSAPSVRATSPDTSVAVAPGAPMQAASTAAGPEAAVPVQFVLDAPAAASVSVVGDFNDWSASASPMQRLPGSGVWTVTLAVSPGRHVYAFMVDGKTWTPDPRAPRAADSDFGTPGSVLLVMPR